MKMILKYGDYLTMGKKYYLLFSYKSQVEALEMYQFIRKEIMPKYSCTVKIEDSDNEFLMPFSSDQNGNALYGPNYMNTRMYNGINLPEDNLHNLLNIFMLGTNATLQVGNEMYSQHLTTKNFEDIKKKLRPELNNYYTARNISQFQKELTNYDFFRKLNLDYEILERQKELEKVLSELPGAIQGIKSFLQIYRNSNELNYKQDNIFQAKLDLQRLKANFKECERENTFIFEMHSILETSILDDFLSYDDIEKNDVIHQIEQILKDLQTKISIEKEKTHVFEEHLKTFTMPTDKEEKLRNRLKNLESFQNKKVFFEHYLLSLKSKQKRNPTKI